LLQGNTVLWITIDFRPDYMALHLRRQGSLFVLRAHQPIPFWILVSSSGDSEVFCFMRYNTHWSSES
jgi:hypothetical protein